jgi:hypothetical protein
MKRTTLVLLAVSASIVAAAAARQEAPPAAPEQTIDRLVGQQAPGRPIRPAESGQTDRTSGSGAVAPDAPPQALLREGTFLIDRTGRLARSADGQWWEFTFVADGQAMRDPPVRVLPNLKLMSMEDALTSTNRDLMFRVTGILTEYRGRNHILLEKVIVVPEGDRPF